MDRDDDPSPRDELFAPTLRAADRGLSFAGSRALLYSHVAIDMLRRQIVEQVGEDLARSIVAQAGRKAGFHDAQLLLQARHYDRVQTTLEMQYEVLRASGFGRFEILALELELEQRSAYVHVRCLGSAEAESHVRLFGRGEVPACWHLVGYSTGWITAMTGVPLLTVESRCVARGDAHCELETLPYDDFVGPEAGFWKRVFEDTSTSVARKLASELANERELVRVQERALEQLSAPILQVSDEILVLPVIGAVDEDRVVDMSEKLLAEVAKKSARGIILDVTGMEAESQTESGRSVTHLLRMARAVKLLGAKLVMTGISPALARTLVERGVDLSGFDARASLQDGIRELERWLRARRGA